MDKLYMKAQYVGQKDVGGQKLYTYRATTAVEDRQNDIVTLDGWDFANYQGNPVILDSHKYDGIENIVGRGVMPMRFVDGAWEVDIQFSESNERGRLAKGLADEEMLNAVSVGFLPKEIARAASRGEPDRITKKELLEISVCAVPANPEALRVRGLDGGVGVAELAAAIAKALGGGKTMPKAADFDTILQIEETEADLWEQRWRMSCALDEANQAAAEDDAKTPEERLAAIQTNYEQFSAKMLDWWKAWIALDDAADAAGADADEEGEGMKTLRRLQKAGRRLSAESMKAIEKAIGHKHAAIKLLEGLLAGGQEEDGKPKDGEDANPGDKGAGPTGAKGADPSPNDVTLSTDIGALVAFVGQ